MVIRNNYYYFLQCWSFRLFYGSLGEYIYEITIPFVDDENFEFGFIAFEKILVAMWSWNWKYDMDSIDKQCFLYTIKWSENHLID